MKTQNLGLLILRLSIGILLLLHGVNKIFHGVGFIENMLRENGLPAFITYGVFIGEVLAPIMIILGYRTRIFSLIIVANMLVITFMVKKNLLFAFAQTGAWELELQGLYLFGALALFFTGAGKIAVSNNSFWD